MLEAIEKVVDVPAGPRAVWNCWTTRDGLRSFLAPDARVELKLLGPFEILFNPDQPPGLQGTEGMRVLAWQVERMLAFEWNAPPDFPEVRSRAPETFVVVQIEPRGVGARVRLIHGGWPDRPEYTPVHAYFSKAWDSVMCWLESRFTRGPVDWKAGPPRPGRSYAAGK